MKRAASQQSRLQNGKTPTKEKIKPSQTNRSKTKGLQPSQKSVAKQQPHDDYWSMDVVDDVIQDKEVVTKETCSQKQQR